MRDRATSQRFVPLMLAFAVFVAPFIGLLYDVKAGLAIMAATLSATALVVREASKSAIDVAVRRLNLMAGINFALAAACVLAIVWLLANGR